VDDGEEIHCPPGVQHVSQHDCHHVIHVEPHVSVDDEPLR
jgi:hypothetical protein